MRCTKIHKTKSNKIRIRIIINGMHHFMQEFKFKQWVETAILLALFVRLTTLPIWNSCGA